MTSYQKDAHRRRKSTSHSKPLPAHWPPAIQYLKSLRYADSVPTSVINFLTTSINTSVAVGDERRIPCVVVRRIEDLKHPAFGQFGLFASKKILPHSHILDYLGEVHCEERPDSSYDLSLYRSPDGSINVGVDAAIMGNEARMINDYRGIRPKPNALFKDGRTASGELRMSVWSNKEPIRKGEEVLVSYGKAWWNARSSPDVQGLMLEQNCH